MNLRIGNISSLQLFQLLRFSTFLLIGIVFTKTNLGKIEIGQYETVLFVAGAISFFWLNGLIQGLLSLFKKEEKHSSQFFNVFILLSIFSLIAILFLILFEKSIAGAMLQKTEIPFLKYLSVYLLFSVPASLVEYIYLLKEKAKSIVNYGIISYSAMLLMVTLPVLFNQSIEYSIIGLVLSAIIRYVWLLVLLVKHSIWQISLDFIVEHVKLSIPLVLSAVLSGSAQYIDGFIVTSHFDEATFAVFRYGAREFPLVLLLANAFSTAMIPRFSNQENLSEVLHEIKAYSIKLMHFLFPLSIVLIGITHWLFPIVFNTGFSESATIFNIYLLLIISRLFFPQTILIGLKNTSLIAWASFLEITINVSLSLWFVVLWGLPGIAYATIVAYIFEKLFLAFMLVKKTGISARKYMNISLHLTYSLLLVIVFYFIEFVIY